MAESRYEITVVEEKEDGKYALTVIDPLDWINKEFIYKADQELFLSPSEL